MEEVAHPDSLLCQILQRTALSPLRYDKEQKRGVSLQSQIGRRSPAFCMEPTTRTFRDLIVSDQSLSEVFPIITKMWSDGTGFLSISTHRRSTIKRMTQTGRSYSSFMASARCKDVRRLPLLMSLCIFHIHPMAESGRLTRTRIRGRAINSQAGTFLTLVPGQRAYGRTLFSTSEIHTQALAYSKYGETAC